jgi:hypothetical protein
MAAAMSSHACRLGELRARLANRRREGMINSCVSIEELVQKYLDSLLEIRIHSSQVFSSKKRGADHEFFLSMKPLGAK